jgi:hypothetical protein
MYSYLGENGVGLRLPADVRQAFPDRYRTTLYQTHGTVQKEYVTVPADAQAQGHQAQTQVVTPRRTFVPTGR